MTYDDFKELLTKIVASPDTMTAELPGLMEKVKGHFETATATAEKLATAEDRIRTLQDTNQRLFLAQLGEPAKESEPELEGHAAVDAFVKELMTEKEV